MSTPTKENKRCHVVSGKTPNEKKESRQERISGSRKSLDYKSAAAERKINKVCDVYFIASFVEYLN